MPRKLGGTGDVTRDRILETSLPLFAEYGFAGTSTRTVAQAAGVNVATIAYHFGDKEGLYEAVVQRLHEDLTAHFPTGLPVGVPLDTLREVIRIAWRFAREHRVHMRLLVRHVLDQGEHPHVVADRWAEPLLSKGSEIVGLMRPDLGAVQRRLVILTMMHVVARFAIEDEAQLAKMVGAADPDPLLVDFLVDQARCALGLPRAS